MKPILFLLVVLQLSRIRGETDECDDYKAEYEQLNIQFKEEREKLNFAEQRLLSATKKITALETELKQQSGSCALKAQTAVPNESSKLFNYFGCGITKSKELKWPWMASLLGDKGYFCGGSIITNRHILTSTACARRHEPTDIKVRLGEYDFNVRSTFEVEFAVEKIILHPGFNRRTLAHDIAILKLKEPIDFTTRFQPVCLPPKDMAVTGKFATVTGWGITETCKNNSFIINNTLQEQLEKILTNENCSTIFHPGTVGDDQLCAASDEGNVYLSTGTSGSPLMLKTDAGSWSIVGIVSGGVDCNKPTIYARITDHLDWIRESI